MQDVIVLAQNRGFSKLGALSQSPQTEKPRAVWPTTLQVLQMERFHDFGRLGAAACIAVPRITVFSPDLITGIPHPGWV